MGKARGARCGGHGERPRWRVGNANRVGKTEPPQDEGAVIFVVLVHDEVCPAHRETMRVVERGRFYANFSPAHRETTERMDISS